MASQVEINQLVGTALLRSDFRAKLLRDPAATAKEVGIALNPLLRPSSSVRLPHRSWTG
jgi:hypothetical protein